MLRRWISPAAFAFALVCLFVLTATPARASSNIKGFIQSTAGASTNNFTTSTPFLLKPGQRYDMQCDGAARVKWGAGSGTTAIVTAGATLSLELIVAALDIRACDTSAGQDAIAIIPPSGTATLNCYIYEVLLP